MKHTKGAVIALILGLSASLAAASRASGGLTVSYLGEWSGGTGGSITDDTIDGPIALALDAAGRVYIAEQNSNRVQVFTTDGHFVRRWGTRWPCTCQPADSSPHFFLPSGIAIDSAGNVYVSDLGHYVNGWPARVQKFSPEGLALAAWEGVGLDHFSYPRDVAVDASGNVYVADWGKNRVLTLAGDGAFVREWAASEFYPWSLAVDDRRGLVYVDALLYRTNGTSTIGYFQVSPFSLAGESLDRWTTADQPGTKIAVDRQGRVYGTIGSTIKVFGPGGELLGQWGSSGAGPGQFTQATGIAVDDQGLVYVADFLSARIQVFRVVFD